MKSLLCFLTVLLLSQQTISAQNKYVYNINLQSVDSDRVRVMLVPPNIKSHKVLFVIPSVIPGSYARKDYGRFISRFKAFAANNKPLKVKQNGSNLFCIRKARKLARVEYWVSDTWDDTDIGQFVFQPGGSNIEAEKNFAINHHAFFGYFEGLKMLPFELHFEKPQQFYGATALEQKQISATEDVFFSANYIKLVDNPILYCQPDTTSFTVRNTTVYVAVYSPNKTVQSATVATYLQPLANALGDFFGTLPVNKYHFLFYFADPNTKLPETKGLGGYGALEHSYSSFYYLPEIEHPTALKNMVQDVCGHEFLHILTPLNVHSEQIENFNFVNPDMSQHLWLYEGVTEYFSILVQLRAGLITPDEFKTKIRNKIIQAQNFPPISFTKMSRQIVNDEYQDDYLNVYQKGALIGFCLDLELTRYSNGKYGLRELMLDLAKKYGPNKPFKDSRLFDDIAEMTSHSIGDFLNQYVAGTTPLPFAELFNAIGWQYTEHDTYEGYYFGSFGIGYDAELSEFIFTDVGENTLNIKENDVLVAINNNPVNFENIRQQLLPLFNANTAGEVALTIKRNGIATQLSGKPEESTLVTQHAITDISNPNKEQLQLRQFLFTGNPSSAK